MVKIVGFYSFGLNIHVIFFCIFIYVRSATGVLPAVPPIPKAAGTLASYGDEQLSPVLNSSLNLQKRFFLFEF